MMKSKLYALAAAAFFSMNANAQTWEGEVPTSGEYMLYNVEAGAFIECGTESWGTNGSVGTPGIMFKTVVNGNTVTLEGNVTNGGQNYYLGSGGWADSGVFAWTFAPLSDGKYTLANNGALLGYNGVGATLAINGANADDPKFQWLFISKQQRIDALDKATESNGVDASFYIKCPNLGRNNRDWSAWNENTHHGSNANWFREVYNAGCDVNQTIEVDKPGIYEVSCQGFYRAGLPDAAAASKEAGTEDVKAYIYANDAKEPLASIFSEAKEVAGNGFSKSTSLGYIPNSVADAQTIFTNGGYFTNKVRVVVGADLKIKFGIKKTETIAADWTCFDSFRLTYYGAPADLSAYMPGFESAKAAATGVDKTKPMNAGVKSALESALLSYNVEFSTLKSATEISTATTALNDAATAAAASVNAYAAVAAKIATLDETGKAAFLATEVGKAYTNKTYVDEDITAELVAAAKAQGVGADMTLAAPATWTCPQGNGPAPFKTGIETFSANVSFVPGKVIYQKIEGLQPGTYEVEFVAAANLAAWQGQTGSGDGIAQIYANNTTQDITVIDQKDCTLEDYVRKIQGVVTKDGVLEYGIQNIADGGCWYVCQLKSVKFVKAGVDLSSYQTALEKELATAQAISGTMSSVAKSRLESAIESGNKTYSTEDEYTGAISNLQSAITGANESIENYKTAAPYVTKGDDLDATGQASYKAAAKDFIDSYNDRSFVALSDDDKAALDAAYIAAAKAQTSAGANVTAFIVNPSFETGNINGWTTTNGNDTGAKPNSNATYTMDGCAGNYLFNTWAKDAASAPIKQEISGLKNGQYKVTAVMGTDAEHELYVSVNGAKGTATSVDKATGVQVTATGDVLDGTITIEAGSDGIWYKADDFKLTLVKTYTDAEVAEIKGQAAAAELATAKTNKLAEIEAITPSNDLFKSSKSAIDAAKAAVNAATTVDDVNAVTVAVNTPVAGKAYAFKNNTADGYLSFAEGGVKIGDMSPVIFEAVEGGYVLTNGTEYVNKTTNNTWSLSTSDKAGAYVVTVNPVDGGYTISGARGIMGTDSKDAGSVVFANKDAGKNGIWTIVDYVAPATPELAITDGTAVTAEADKTYDMTYTRSFSKANSWQSLALPVEFVYNDEQVELAMFTGASVEDDGTTVINIAKVKVGEVIANNQPLLISAKTAGTKEIALGEATLYNAFEKGQAIDNEGNVVITNVLTAKKTGIAGKFVMSGGALKVVGDDSNKLGVNRWFMTINVPSGAEVRFRIEGFDGVEATGIASAIAESLGAKAYSINGAQVDASNAKGVYIQNGKKFIRK